jgi:long-chain acyl-CoA synthetase
VSGFNVYPNEVEEKIAAVAGVQEVGVVGVPDDKTGESVVAYVVTVHPAATEEQIMAYCRDQLSAYKVPKKIVFVEELPKSPIGKILRRELRTLAISESSSQKGTS